MVGQGAEDEPGEEGGGLGEGEPADPVDRGGGGSTGPLGGASALMSGDHVFPVALGDDDAVGHGCEEGQGEPEDEECDHVRGIGTPERRLQGEWAGVLSGSDRMFPGVVETLTWDGLVPVAQVLAHAEPAYGGDTWEEAFAVLHGDPAEDHVISELVASLDGARSFREPIVISFDDEDGVYRLSNGMHRMATAVAQGWDQVLVTSGYPDHGEVEYVEVYYRLPGDWPADDVDNDEIAFACGWLRSFPLPDGTWVETDLIAQNSGVMHGMWLCPPRLADALVAELVARSPAFELVAMRCVTGAELDAEYAAEEASEALVQ